MKQDIQKTTTRQGLTWFHGRADGESVAIAPSSATIYNKNPSAICFLSAEALWGDEETLKKTVSCETEKAIKFHDEVKEKGVYFCAPSSKLSMCGHSMFVGAVSKGMEEVVNKLVNEDT